MIFSSLPGRLTAIHYENVTRDVVGGIGGEKHDGPLEVMLAAETPERNPFQKEFPMMLQDQIRHVRGKPTRSNRIYLNVVLGPFAGQVFGETDNSPLAGVIANSVKL